ncbi:type VI secretion system Vgr family protein [Polyangium aurulentum]|uniref:type VI secretion system Vgr family protein n=1 Tax=Polyangium aurulentum TaxID=2567896 RepID=UPI0010AE8C36|nr:type VI secretion system tip protein TssI/VgrG [Polyangium aurulentum]UQA63177.1 type VI secretion system tip protein VgrG [Polyangium aurulentum]
MSLGQSFALSIDGISSVLHVLVVEGLEAVRAPFAFHVTVEATDGEAGGEALDVEALLGARAELSLGGTEPVRTLYGLIDEAEEIAAGYRVTFSPRARLLEDRVDHRVFVDRDAVEIAATLLGEHGIPLENRVLRKLPKRPQCVQAFESDLGFLGRILAEEAVLWHIEHDSGADSLVLSDHTSAYTPIDGVAELPFSAGEIAGLAGEEAIVDASLTRVVTSDKVSLGDFHFERPLADLRASAGKGTLERHEYRGGYKDAALGKTLAALRLAEARGRSVVLAGKTTSRRLSPGMTFTLSGAPREDMNGDWLVLELTHRGSDPPRAAVQARQDTRRYEADFIAVPADRAYCPPRARRPTLGGVQTATVTGADGAEIHPDKHGRIKVLLRWDRRGEKDDRSSTWIRTVQPPLSGGVFVPRVGWEVLLGFQGTSGDEPYEIGRLYNAEAPPPEGLPGQKVRGAFGTLTTPGGGSANVLRMDDAAGNEGMLLAASRDLNERTENDKGINIKGDDVHSVGADHTEIVGIASSLAVDGSQAYSVGASREVTTVGNYMIETGTESVTVGGARIFKVGGDYETQAATLTRAVGGLEAVLAIQEASRHVTGASTVLVGGSWTEIGGLSAATSVLGASTLGVAGPMSIRAKDYSLKASALKETYASKRVTAGGKRVESFSAAAKYSVGGSMKISGGGGVYFKATSKITLKASGATITITPSSIKVKGALDASGSSIVTGKDEND